MSPDYLLFFFYRIWRTYSLCVLFGESNIDHVYWSSKYTIMFLNTVLDEDFWKWIVDLKTVTVAWDVNISNRIKD